MLALGINTKNRRLYSWKDTAVCDLLKGWILRTYSSRRHMKKRANCALFKAN